MAQPSPDNCRALIVDDEPAMLNAYDTILVELQNSAGHASNAVDAIESELFASSLSGARCANTQEQDCVIRTCDQGDKAVEAIRQARAAGEPFSVVFVDMGMPPGTDGVETARRVRAIDPDINIVMVTGYFETHPREIAQQIEPVEKLFFIAKPFKGPEIGQLAAALSRKWASEKQLERSLAEVRRNYQDLKRSHEAAGETINRIFQISSAKSQFIYNLANKFDRPLRDVHRYIEQAIHQGVVTDEGEHASQCIIDIMNTLGQMQQLVKSDGGSLLIQNDRVEVAGLLDKIRQNFAPEFDKRDIAFSVSCKPDGFVATTDPKLLEQIMSHLLSNALRRTSAGDQVTLLARGASDHMCFAVIDDGQSPFVSDHSEDKQSFETVDVDPGSADSFDFGVALARSMAEAIGGFLDVDKSGEDLNRFMVTLKN